MIGAPDMLATGGYVAVPAGGFMATLRRAAALSFEGVEILAAQRGTGDLLQLREALAATGLRVAGVNSGRLFSEAGLALLCGDSRHCANTRSAILELIRLAAPFRTHINIGLFRGRPAGLEQRPALDRLTDTLRQLGDYAQRLGVELLIEPQNRAELPFIVGTDEGIAFVKRVAHPAVGLMLDTFHMLAEQEDLPTSLERAMPYLRHVHLLDARRNPPRPGVDPGFDLPGVLGALARLGYRHFLSVPLISGADDEATAQAARELRSLIAKPAH
jgi:D-psicose/D-tagatose/L-ribulose 3-epimerase